MSKIIYPESEGINVLVEKLFHDSLENLKQAQSLCSYSIPADFAYVNYLKELPSKVQSYVNEANNIVSRSKEIDNMFKLTNDTLKDKCSSLDTCLLEARDRLVK